MAAKPILPIQPGPWWREVRPGQHVCRLHAGEADLARSLAVYVGGGLWSGEAAIVIATETHLARLEELLRGTGLDLGHLRADERYFALSATNMLDAFMVDGWPDRLLFAQAIREPLARARRGARGVRLFGEMVALLWAEARYAAAVRLEHLWNELVAREQVPLVCSYPRGELSRGGPEAMAAVTAAHDRMVEA